MVLLLLSAILLWFVPQPAAAAPSTYEDGVYVYDLFRDAPGCTELQSRLNKLSLRSTLILSIEERDGFVLDRPQGDEQLTCVFDYLRDTSRRVKALLAQDTVFLENKTEAVRRARLVIAFAAQHPGVLAGVQLDVEPYTDPKWGCCTPEQRRAMMRDLQDLLGQVRRQLNGLPLSVTAPWWYAVVKDIPEAQPESLFQVADEIYLMVYGDEGGPLIGGSAERVLSRVDSPEFFTGRGRMIIGLGTYEFASPAQLETELETVRRRLAPRPNFGGTVIFNATSVFNVPLVRTISGLITDPDGNPLPGVDIESANLRAHGSDCGQFGMRDFSGPQAEITFRKSGYVTRTISVDLPAPGGIRELGKIVLEKEKDLRSEDTAVSEPH